MKSYEILKIQEYPEESDGIKDKVKYIFSTEDREKAQECYKFFSSHDQNRRKKGNEENVYDFLRNETIKIYLQKDEEIFEKYADEEAALYEQA